MHSLYIRGAFVVLDAFVVMVKIDAFVVIVKIDVLAVIDAFVVFSKKKMLHLFGC